MHTAPHVAFSSHSPSLPLTVMAAPVTVALPEVLHPHERLVRRAWSRCLALPGLPASHGSEGLTTAARAALDALTTSVTLRGIERHRGEALMFHAAGLAHPATGATVVLVAASGTGKTTAATRLGRELEYVSDETVCVDPQSLAIAPYPKPLSVVTRPGEPKAQVGPDELGLLPVTQRPRMHALLTLERSPATTVPHVTEPLPLVEALAALVPNLSALPSLPDPLRTLVRVVDACGGVRAVRYREIDDVAARLVDLAAAPAVPTVRTGTWTHWEPTPAEHAEPFVPPVHVRPDELPDTLVPGPWVQALENPEDPSQLLLLLPESLVVLAGIAPALWGVCRERGARSPRELTRALVALCGPVPDAERLTRECAAHLLGLGVLRPGPGRT
ncbi:hypothetical protein [Kocuria sp.]|uniref:hypothetical protein n=1 Tax=Kocuria sp. TaxID=1871328 RepID=UPI0026DD8630|nr:hypothetical protein [Kocuria sp.]MDO4919659.1 hypothetical protein [Kocuria sp.]